jgi:hypothetical protein
MFHEQEEIVIEWDRVIARNSEALIAIAASLVRMLRLDIDDAAERIPGYFRLAALRILRPAESAARRLIYIVARDLVVTLRPARAKPQAPGRKTGKGSSPTSNPSSTTSPNPAFQLFDPRKNFAPRRPPRKRMKFCPRIAVLGHDPTVAAMWAFRAPTPPPPPPPEDDGLVDALPLRRRVIALQAALADLPGQARRLARWRARRQRQRARRPTFACPMRPGAPPGYRRKPIEEVDKVLHECQHFALAAIRLDTS